MSSTLLFERGIDPKKALRIGDQYREIKRGDTFTVEFCLRKSCPEYYPLQKQKLVRATAIEDESEGVFGGRTVLVKINDDDSPYHATYDEKIEHWSII